MNSKVKTVLGIILFILFMGGAYYAYHALSEKNKPDLIELSKNQSSQPSPTGNPSVPAETTPAVTSSPDVPTGTAPAVTGNPDISVDTTPAVTDNPDGPSETTPAVTDSVESKPDISPSATVTPNETSAEEGGSQDETEYKLAALDFTVYDAQGNEVKLSDFFGKPIIINFWATWCPYCVEEMPVFEEAYRNYGDDIHFLMIDDVDGKRETQAVGESFIQEKGYTFPVYYDTEGFAGYTYQVYSLPTSVFIDGEGYIVIYYPGPLTAEMLQQGIDFVLAGSEG